jgi:hypothetical protein
MSSYEGTRMDNIKPEQGLLEAARVIRPYLPDLVGPEAKRLDGQISELLARADTDDTVTTSLRSLLDQHEATRDFLAEVLADAPRYLPPDLRPDGVRSRDPGLQPLPGPVGPVYADLYSCPYGDFEFYQLALDDPIPPCPTHGPGLTRT